MERFSRHQLYFMFSFFQICCSFAFSKSTVFFPSLYSNFFFFFFIIYRLVIVRIHDFSFHIYKSKVTVSLNLLRLLQRPIDKQFDYVGFFINFIYNLHIFITYTEKLEQCLFFFFFFFFTFLRLTLILERSIKAPLELN